MCWPACSPSSWRGWPRKFLAETTDPQERWQRLQEVLGQLAKLRTEDHKWQRLQIDRERWEEEQERCWQEQSERDVEKAKQKATAPLWAWLMQGPLAAVFGGWKTGRKIAKLITAIENGLPLPPTGAPAPEAPTQSSPVKDSQG